MLLGDARKKYFRYWSLGGESSLASAPALVNGSFMHGQVRLQP